MMRSLWISKTGLDAQQTQLDVISNNLANVSTNGYKRARAVFEDLLYQNIRQPGAMSSQQNQVPSGLQLGVGSRTVATVKNFSQGGLSQTNNNLDLAINGNGFFTIQMPDGNVGYTRDGSFQLDSQGQVVTSNGYLLQPPITVPPNTNSISIAEDGVVSVSIAGQQQPQQIGQLQLANFINPAGLQPIGQNLFLESASSGGPIVGQPNLNGLGSLKQSMVETSNVNVVEELVGMIQTQRAYEINAKAVTTSDQMLGRLTQI